VLVVKMDVTIYEDCAWMIRLALERFTSISLLILNAGVGAHSRFWDIEDPSTIENIMKTNFLGYAYMIKAALPVLTSKSQLVVISSLSGIIGLPFRSVYCASKFAVNGLIESLRVEEPNLKITLICPSSVETNFW